MIIHSDNLGELGEKIIKLLLRARVSSDCSTRGNDPDLHFDRGFIEVKTCIAYYLHFDKRDNKYRLGPKYFYFYRSQHKSLLEKLEIVDGFYGLVTINGRRICFRLVPIEEINKYIKKSKAKEKISVMWTRFFDLEEVGPPPKDMRETADKGRLKRWKHGAPPP